jgi:hypothetical protein
LWRTEIEPTGSTGSTRFLNVLIPRLKKDQGREPEVEPIAAGSGVDAVRVGDSIAVFAHDAEPIREVKLNGGGASKCILLDAVPGATYRVGKREWKASSEGVLYATELPKGSFVIGPP